VTALITQYGPFGVFLLMVPESACIPVPSEVTLLFSGFAVAQHWMSLPLAIIAATAGNVVGSLLAYAVGATRVLNRVPGARQALEKSQSLLKERPLRSVFVARLLPLARTFVSLPAGARRLPLVPFTALTAAGCAIWATAFVLIGIVSGSAYAAVGSVAGKVGLATAAAFVAFAVVRKRRQGRRRDPPTRDLGRSRAARR
jgi:membrane protein DedA with SNARE-associated domain